MMVRPLGIISISLLRRLFPTGGFGGKGAAEGGLSIGMGGKGDFSAGEPGSNGLAIITFFSFLDIVGFLE
jgi:hypothetical protein